METSGTGALSVAAQIVLIALFVNVGFRMLPASRPFPWLAPVVVVVVGVPSLLQGAFPVITETLARDPHRTVADGEWWRVLTALLAQDGELVAAIFTLVVVALAVTLGTWIWGPWLALALFLAPSIVLNVLAVLWNRPGGGSSFASNGLMLSICALAVVIGTGDARRPSRQATMLVRILGLVALAVGVVLTVAGDAHGVAMLLGFAFGLIAAWSRRHDGRSA